VKNPFTGESAFSHMYVTYAGMVWNGTATPTRYEREAGALEDAPAAVRAVAARACAAALLALPGEFPAVDWEGAAPENLTCAFNVYATLWSYLSAHVDSAEPSLARAKGARRYPVVSISVGDAAIFTLWPDYKDGDRLGEPLDVELRSGDVVIFGGDARLVRHEVNRERSFHGGKVRGPRAGAARGAPGLCMVPGRLNVTLRKL